MTMKRPSWAFVMGAQSCFDLTGLGAMRQPIIQIDRRKFQVDLAIKQDAQRLHPPFPAIEEIARRLSKKKAWGDETQGLEIISEAVNEFQGDFMLLANNLVLVKFQGIPYLKSLSSHERATLLEDREMLFDYAWVVRYLKFQTLDSLLESGMSLDRIATRESAADLLWQLVMLGGRGR
jgi:hypothetical protein